jgi:hypothetical protein
MKHKDFTPCHLCGKGVMHAGHPLFLRISIDRMGVNRKAVEQAHGLELMMGGNALLANVMGPNEDLATVIDGKHDMLVCSTCASTPLPPYFWLDDGEEAGPDSDPA